MIRDLHAPAAGLPPLVPWPNVHAGRSQGVTVVPASHLQPEAPNWVWPNHLAAGKLTLLGGGPGTGKTTIAMSVAAIVSVGSVGGRNWPDGSLAPQGDVLIWTGEDGIEDTLLPRLMAADADLRRVHFIRETTTGGRVRAFDPATDIPQLVMELSRHQNIRLLIVDSIVQAVAGNANSNQDVRQSMEPLLALAETFGCAVLGISHLNKGSKNKSPLERITGSLAFGAVARVVWMTSRIAAAEDGSPGNVMVKAKANIGPNGGGFEYAIESKTIPAPNTVAGFIETSCVVWGDTLTGSAEEILRAAESTDSSRDASAVDRAAQFLAEVLSVGPRGWQEICALADQHGISTAALKRAKKAGRPAIKSEKIRGAGSASGFMWSLMSAAPNPAAETATSSGFGSMAMPMPISPAMGHLMQPAAMQWWQDTRVVQDGVPGHAQIPIAPFAGIPAPMPPSPRSGFPVVSPDVIGQSAMAGYASPWADPGAVIDRDAVPASSSAASCVAAHAPLAPVASVEPLEPVEPVVPGDLTGIRDVWVPQGHHPAVAQQPVQAQAIPVLNDAMIDWAHKECVKALELDKTRPDLDFYEFLDSVNRIAWDVIDNAEFESDDEDAADTLRSNLYRALKSRQWWNDCKRLGA